MERVGARKLAEDKFSAMVGEADGDVTLLIAGSGRMTPKVARYLAAMLLAHADKADLTQAVLDAL